ncbi:MAG: hypothetical protein OWT27_04970 [Firmicutes bacterium]|nr:hypothetical protein [Bacillota bacterium]
MFIRRRCSLLRLILIALGFRFLLRRAHDRSGCEDRSSADRAIARARARAFREKMRDAMSVWTDPDFVTPEPPTTAAADATDESL